MLGGRYDANCYERLQFTMCHHHHWGVKSGVMDGDRHVFGLSQFILCNQDH